MEEEFLQPEESSVDSWNTDEITSCFFCEDHRARGHLHATLRDRECVCACLYHHSHDFHTVNPS